MKPLKIYFVLSLQGILWNTLIFLSFEKALISLNRTELSQSPYTVCVETNNKQKQSESVTIL